MTPPLRIPRLYRMTFQQAVLMLLILVFGTDLTAQIEITGRLQEQGTGAAIPFANIGIENTSYGTLSNTDGTFSIQVPETSADREILFSSLGFEPVFRKVKDLQNEKELIISLETKIVELDPITLVPEKKTRRKSITLGNGKSLLTSGKLVYDDMYAGSAMGLLINKKQYPELPYIQKVSLYIAGNKSPDFKVRLRIMAVDSANGGVPGRDLIEDQILAFSDIEKGWLEFDLPKSYRIEEDVFYLVFEWILEKRDRQFIVETYETFIRENPDRVSYVTINVDGKEIRDTHIGKILAGTMFGVTKSKSDLEHYPTYSRANSFGSWERTGSTLSAKVEIGNQPPAR